MMLIKKWQAIEGNGVHLDGGAMFGHVPRLMWEKWIKPNEQNRIYLAGRALLVQTTDGRNILFEAGTGTFFDPKMKERYGVTPNEHILLKNLEKAGVSEKDIDAVVLSHLHFDHAGGILSAFDDGPQRILFPNAKIYVGKRNWEFSQNPHPREAASYIPHLNPLLKASGRLVLIEGETHPDLDFGVSFIYSDGHTIGLMLAVLQLDSGPMIFATDLIPGIAWVHLPVYLGYDRFAELKVDEKLQLYKKFLDKNVTLFFTHDPHISHAKLICENGKYGVKE